MAITRVAYDETLKNIWDVNSDLAHEAKIGVLNVRRMVNLSTAKFFKLLCAPSPVEDDIGLLGDVKNMYDMIWNDPTKTVKLNNWAKHKKMTVNDGPPTGFDLLLLSTAAGLTKKHNVELLTYDHDIIDFAEEIECQFHVRIINGYNIRPLP